MTEPGDGEAFLLGLLPCLVGIPLTGLDILAHVREGPMPERLGARVNLQHRAFRARLMDAARDVAEVEAILVHLGAQPPAAPADYRGYVAWSGTIGRLLGAATAPERPAGRLIAAGVHLGDVFQTLCLGFVLLALHDAAPEILWLREKTGDLDDRLATSVEMLERAAVTQEISATARLRLAEVVATLRRLPPLGAPIAQRVPAADAAIGGILAVVNGLRIDARAAIQASSSS